MQCKQQKKLSMLHLPMLHPMLLDLGELCNLT